MEELCRYAGWKIPFNFTLHPVNSPAGLLHFRCISFLLLKIPSEQRKVFRSTGCVPDRHPSTSNRTPGTIKNRASHSSSFSANPNPSTSPPAFDSHFHLDRTSQRIWGVTSGKYPQELIDYAMSENVPRLPVNVIGGVLNFSEPSNHTNIPIPSGNWKIAVGVHPKHIHELTEDRFRRLQQLLSLSSTSALGEVGLDRTVPAKE